MKLICSHDCNSAAWALIFALLSTILLIALYAALYGGYDDQENVLKTRLKAKEPAIASELKASIADSKIDSKNNKILLTQ